MARRDTGPDPKEAALAESRCLNPYPGQVRDPAFLGGDFFDRPARPRDAHARTGPHRSPAGHSARSDMAGYQYRGCTIDPSVHLQY
jgi:hypothetical protein